MRCQDTSGNANIDDFVITFTVAVVTASSTFSGIESPLSENGMWDTPGTSGALSKNNGAYAVDTFDQARLVTPVIGADQYSEITYSQAPVSSSWVGVTTRVQGPTNGSGYLAIAYAGQVRLYRMDDTGSMSYTLLASADAPIDVAPMQLRLESQGSDHRVYFNGVELIDVTETVYANGKPGIAAAYWGGPTVLILSFTGGAIPPGVTPAPLRSNGQPYASLSSGTTQSTLSLTTDENATCRYATTPGVAYSAMPNTFSQTGGLSHAYDGWGTDGRQRLQLLRALSKY